MTRIVAIVGVLVLAGFIYVQGEQIQSLNTTVATLGASVAELQGEVGGFGSTTSELAGQLATVAEVANTSAAGVSETASKLAAQKTPDQVLQAAVARVTPAVVSVVEMQDGKKIGSGSGFFVRSNGYIATNRHVVLDDESSADYSVTLSTGKELQARVAWRDPNNDVAVLKVDGSGYPTATLGTSASVEIGEAVFAVGNALGQYSNSVSTGVISGLNRTISAHDTTGALETLKGVMQTDAAINRGNSGGPLVDLGGAVIGVNVATAVNSDNVSFAIPVDQVKSALAALGI